MDFFTAKPADSSETADSLFSNLNQLDFILIAIIVFSSAIIFLLVFVIILLLKINKNTKYSSPFPDRFNYNGQMTNTQSFQQQYEQQNQYPQQQIKNQQENYH